MKSSKLTQRILNMQTHSIHEGFNLTRRKLVSAGTDNAINFPECRSMQDSGIILQQPGLINTA